MSDSQPKWQLAFQALMQAALESGAQAKDIVLAWMEIASGECEHWSDLEWVTPLWYSQRLAQLTQEQARLLHSRWVAAHMFVEYMGWYPWPLVDLGPDAAAILGGSYQLPSISLPGQNNAPEQVLSAFALQMKDVLPWVGPPDLTASEKIAGLVGLTGFPHKAGLVFHLKRALWGEKGSEAFDDPGGVWVVHRAFCNPAAAVEFCRYGLFPALGAACEGWAEWAPRKISTPIEAVGLLTEWFHGPQNAYSARDNLLAYGDPYVLGFPKMNAQDGSQAWVHLHMDDTPASPGLALLDKCVPSLMIGWNHHLLQDFYDLGVAALSGMPPPGSVEFLVHQKVGGCDSASNFFVAAASAMNIPSLVCKFRCPVSTRRRVASLPTPMVCTTPSAFGTG